jgi:hypothetical protein
MTAIASGPLPFKGRVRGVPISRAFAREIGKGVD